MESTKSAKLLRIMREALAKRATVAEEEGAESGFTLIELMVVLLIIAILLAIAIPTFLGVTGSSYDRQAQSNLTNEMTSTKADFTNNQGYNLAATVASDLNNVNPTLTAESTTVAGGANLSTTNISVGTYLGNGTTAAAGPNDGLIAVLAVYVQKTGTCWFSEDDEQTTTQVTQEQGATPLFPAGTQYAALFNQTNNAECSAGYASGTGGLTWQSNGYPPAP